jgi:flagellin
MPQIINTNISSLNAQRNLDNSQSAQDTALARLSSGLRVNSAKDDAAGLQIANRLDSQIRGLNVASRNAGDGVSLAQIAEGSIESISTNLQRLRELAVQSSNSTNGDSERSALNDEAQQLIAEIERTSGSASFNGVNLLDGSFQDKTFQIGANVGDEISVSLSAVNTGTLGAAETAGLSSNVSQTALTAAGEDALNAGDLTINGVAIAASSATTDILSISANSSSSTAKAAAINAVSDQTGVTAVADANTVEGVVVADGATAITTALDIDINGTTFSVAKPDTGSAAQDLASIADTINSGAAATGVSATVVEVDGGARIDLTAEDGRNITVVGTTTGTGIVAGTGTSGGAATTGNTYTGNYSLVSTDGSDITLGSTTGAIDNAGFERGTFSGGLSGVVSDNVDTTDALESGDVTINGVAIGASKAADDSASTINADGSAIAKAAAINAASDLTGVTAQVNATVVVGTAVAAATTTGGLVINNVAINATATTDALDNQTIFVDAINAQSGATGVTAEIVNNNQLQLTAADGRNIEIDAGASADFGLGTTARADGGSLTLTAGGAFEIGTNTGESARAGLSIGTFGGAETGTFLKDVDISTLAGAQTAISAVDNALNSVNAERSKLGSIQTRFENVISSNQIAVENFSASKSRIVDADFAAETAALSRSQVLQQAGISVLAQANARPQQVLSLLQ